MSLMDRPEDFSNEGNEFIGNPEGFDYMPSKAMKNMSITQQFEMRKIADTMKKASREQLYMLAMDAYALSINTRNFAGKIFKEEVDKETAKREGF